MHRLIGLGVFIAVSLATAGGKNVVVFIADDLSPDAGCYGNTVVKTPHLDSLAKDGVLFRNAFCTTASCSASRSVVLTGLHNHANGQYGHEHDYHKFSSYDWVKSLPVMMQALGYRTARIGKHHNGPEQVYFFQEKLPGNARNPVEMANNCKEFISQSAKPFFLYFATADPHRGGGKAAEIPYQPDRFGNLANQKAYPGIDEVFFKPDQMVVPPFLPDTPDCRAELAQYCQSVCRVDQGLGRLMAILKEAGKWDDTLFIFTSDHGIAMPGAKTTTYEPGLRIPFVVRQPSQKTRGLTSPAMVSLVDLTPTVIDWAGGVEALKGKFDNSTPAKSKAARKANVSGVPQFHGRSILPILEQPNPAGWDEVFASHAFHEIQMYYPMRVIRERKYKLIWNIAHPLPFPFASDLWEAPTWQTQFKQGPTAMYGQRSVAQYIQRPRFELFDLEADPHEATNLAANPIHAQELDRLIAKLKDYQKKTNDPWIMKWDYE